MKISRNWLQNYFDAKLPTTSELCDAITFHAFEIDGVESKDGDDILDIKITPNRGHDALSHRGIAKEVSAILKMPFKTGIDPLSVSRLSQSEGKTWPSGPERPSGGNAAETISLTLEDPTLSPRNIAGYIKGVKVGPSPDWLKNSLEAIGQRSINNVDDATNYVMFNIGQPMHAFDASKLSQKDGKNHIVERRARAEEKISAHD